MCYFKSKQITHKVKVKLKIVLRIKGMGKLFIKFYFAIIISQFNLIFFKVNFKNI